MNPSRRFSGRYPASEHTDLSDPARFKEWAQQRADAQRAAEGCEAFADAVVEYRLGGRQVVISRDSTDGDREQQGGGVRGDVHGFSAAARRRLMQVFASLERDAVPLFVTLTYHETDPSPDVAKKHMDTFAKAVGRKMEGSGWSYIWRMEFQKRGAIHFHLLFYGVSWIPKEWLKNTWHRITDERSKHHRDIGAWVEFIREPNKVTRYVQKYLSKEEYLSENSDWTGRLWGIRNRECLPVAGVQRCVIPWRAAYWITEHVLSEWGSDLDIVPFRLHICTESPQKWINERLKLYERLHEEGKR